MVLITQNIDVPMKNNLPKIVFTSSNGKTKQIIAVRMK